ncbi:ATP-dependent helicase [bacterium]|nr:MAG: ATP-dependent helicase [bacterium]
MKTFVLSTESGVQKPANYKIEYQKQLNDAQYKAVMAGNGAHLIIAGAGTGKTRTLMYRVARLIEDGLHPNRILLLTFTRRAAREMLDRAGSLLDDRCKRVRGGTFHHYCAHILREYASEINLNPNFTILDSSDTQEVLQHVRLPFKEKNKGQRFPEKSTLYGLFSAMTNRELTLLEALSELYPQFIHFHEDLVQLHKSFLAYKELNNLVDFDDLLQLTKELLESNEAVRTKVAAQNEAVLVDEYQDVNKLQVSLIRLFSSVHKNVVAVGDDAQSIYRFRGADHTGILQFPEMFTTKSIIKLEQNYRSTQPILDVANALLSQASLKYEKNLFTEKKTGELPGLVKTSTEQEQSQFLAQYILHLREQGVALQDVAILFRNSRDSFDVEIELNRRGVPYVKYGGQKISEAAHVKDILAHIKVVVNSSDVISWNRILMLIDGIGPKSAAELMIWMQGNSNAAPSKAYIDKIDELTKLISSIKKKQNQVQHCMQQLLEYYAPICKKKYDDYPKRIKDLEALVSMANQFEDFEKLVQDLTLDPIDGTALDTEATQKEENPLVLSTIHSAKGLEWHTVFIIQCLDGVIPSGYSVDKPENLEEELRLLYVACTRAAEQLFITYPIVLESGFGDYFSNPSRFIAGMSEKMLEPWNLVRETPQVDEGNQQLLN